MKIDAFHIYYPQGIHPLDAPPVEKRQGFNAELVCSDIDGSTVEIKMSATGSGAGQILDAIMKASIAYQEQKPRPSPFRPAEAPVAALVGWLADLTK